MPKKIVLTLLRIYQIVSIWILPLPVCRFTPSCSEYTYQAIEKFGLIKGIVKSMKRLFKCHPFGPCGYDPIN